MLRFWVVCVETRTFHFRFHLDYQRSNLYSEKEPERERKNYSCSYLPKYFKSANKCSRAKKRQLISTEIHFEKPIWRRIAYKNDSNCFILATPWNNETGKENIIWVESDITAEEENPHCSYVREKGVRTKKMSLVEYGWGRKERERSFLSICF